MTWLIAPLLKWLAGALALVGAVTWLRRDAAKDAKRETALQSAERQAKTNDRIAHADLGLGATDDERIKRLREFADKP